ncbi:hypothetical protein GCM10020367_51230 [Streptomyces sannanensis]|uniref:Uncharacterized protein n=1 Tax=Streptomyces sannanensis TaxID=285536 RepID=A0ABP6SI62_9ACTN
MARSTTRSYRRRGLLAAATATVALFTLAGKNAADAVRAAFRARQITGV